MKKLKHILVISAIAMLAVVFMPMLQGSDGQASADVETESLIYVDANSTADTPDGTAEKPYKTIQAAIGAAETTSTTIKMVSDFTEKVSIASDKNITLDLNGHELSSTYPGPDSYAVITNKGTLTVKDSSSEKTGKVTIKGEPAEGNNGGQYAACICNEKKLTIDGGTYTSTVDDGDYERKYKLNAECVASDKDDAECTINDGTFKANAEYNAAFAVYCYHKAKLEINGGTLEAKSTGYAAQVVTFDSSYTGSKLTITNGKFAANGGQVGDAIVMFEGSADISGCDIECKSDKSAGEAIAVYAGSSASVNVTGGTFKTNCTADSSSSYGLQNNGGDAKVSGGTFEATGQGNAAGIYQGGTMIIGGSLKVTGNDTNLYLPAGKTVTIGTKAGTEEGNGVAVPVTSGENRMSVGVTTETNPASGNPVDITGANNGDYSSCFTSDNDNYYVKHVSSGTLHLVLAVANIKIADNIENGTVTVSDQGAAAGNTVTVTATPNKGYELDKITVTDKNSTDITETALSGTTITMPDADNLPITVSATFKALMPTFDDRFGGTNLTENSYTKNAVPTQDCHAKTQGYTFAGWSTVIDDESEIISGEPEGGKTYYAVWKNTDTNKIVVTETLNFTLSKTQAAYSTEKNGIKWDSDQNTLTLNGATVDVYGNEKAESSANTQAVILLPAGAKLIADENAKNTVNLNSTTTDEYAFAIEGKGTLEIGGKGTLNVNAKKESDESNVKVYGISTSEKLSINDLTLNVFGQYKAIYKGGQNTDNIEIAGGTINAKCNTANGDVIVEDNGKYAIQAEKGDIVISGGTVSAKGGAIGIIASDGKVDVSDGTVAVDSGTQGLYANTSVDITGGKVDATAHGYVYGQTGKNAKAIYSKGTIGISGTANVSANCINDKDVTAEGAEFYGIRSKDNITITGKKAVVTAKGTTAAFNLESGKTVTATNAVIRAGEDEASASVQTGDVTNAVTGNKYAKINWEPVFDDRFGGTNLTENSYTKGEVPTQGCHAKTQGYTFAGWSTAIDDADSIITGEPEGGKTYYAVWKKNGKTVITQPLNFTSMETTDKSDDQGWSWNKTDNTLTLNGAIIDIYQDANDAKDLSAIILPADSKIVISADSTITDTYKGSKNEQFFALYCPGTLDISGDKKLTIKTGADNGATAMGICADGGLTYDKATLDITSDCTAIKVSGDPANITISGGSITTKVTHSADDGLGYGIQSDKGNISISAGTITTTGGNRGIIAGYAQDSNRTITVSGGTISASGAQAGLWASGDVNISTGTVTATATGTDNTDCGINSQAGNIAITGGTVTATGDEYGIHSKNGDITLNSGNVTAKGNTSAFSKVPAFGGKVDAQASTSIDGTSPVDYEEADNSTYKWVKTSAVENGVCSIEKGEVTTEYSTLAKAVKAAAENDVIKITADTVTLKKNLTVSEDKKFSIDLNGKTIDLNEHHIICHGNLTVTDTSGNAVGVIKNGKPTDAEAGNDNCGGAVALILKDPAKTPTFVLEKGTISGCSADAGGAVFVGEGAKLEINSNGTIDDCDAVYGGGVYNYRGDVDVYGTIKNCTAENYGGGIYNDNLVNDENNKGSVTIAEKANITDCSADGGEGEMGGGIFNRGTLTMNGGTISGCSAEKGAGVHNDGTEKVSFEMRAGEIKNNSEAQVGGAVFVGEGAEFQMSGGTIDNCSATSGGAVFNYRGKVVVSGTIKDCTAKNYGGGIYNDNLVNDGDNKGSVTIAENANITGCSAKDGTDMMGGGIFNKGTLTMNGGTISGCSAAKGAGVHNDGTNEKVKFELNGGEIKDNTAAQNGGGIQNSANAVLTINGGSITGNKATNNYGGGVFSAGTLNFGNAAKITITGNKGTASEVNSNVAFAKGTTGTVTAGTLSTGSSIGVMAIKKYDSETSYNLTENEVITNFTAAENSFFTSDDEDYELDLDTGADKIKFQRKAAVKGTGDVAHGTVSIDPTAPITGQEVTITATPDSGYDVGTIKVTDKEGNEIAVTGGKFTMPAKEYLLPVTISVEFTKKPTPPPTPVTKYTVTFDNQGHGAVPQSQSVEKGGKVSDPGSLTEEGYVFGGWFTDKECTDAWDFDNDTVTKSMTLYAKWTEKKKELIDIEDCDIELSKYEFVFNNKVQTPEVTVRYGESILTEGQDYVVNVDEYKEVGKYDVEISGIGEYTGVTVDHYTINPAPKAVKAVKAGKKKLAVYWKKSTKAYREQTTKFQIRYSTSKKFTAAKNVYAKPAASGKVIKKLKAHKKYYVKMRVIKYVNGERFYSSWSKVKAKKTK